MATFVQYQRAHEDALARLQAEYTRLTPQEKSRRVLGRWAYFACLLFGSIFLVHLGEHTRRALALAARRGLARAGD